MDTIDRWKPEQRLRSQTNPGQGRLPQTLTRHALNERLRRCRASLGDRRPPERDPVQALSVAGAPWDTLDGRENALQRGRRRERVGNPAAIETAEEGFQGGLGNAGERIGAGDSGTCSSPGSPSTRRDGIPLGSCLTALRSGGGGRDRRAPSLRNGGIARNACTGLRRFLGSAIRRRQECGPRRIGTRGSRSARAKPPPGITVARRNVAEILPEVGDAQSSAAFYSPVSRRGCRDGSGMRRVGIRDVAQHGMRPAHECSGDRHYPYASGFANEDRRRRGRTQGPRPSRRRLPISVANGCHWKMQMDARGPHSHLISKRIFRGRAPVETRGTER